MLLLLYFGGVEVSDVLTVKRKVTHVTSSLGDLVTQTKSVTAAEMDDILEASSSIMAPYPETKLKIKVTGVQIDSKGKATVAWSDAKNDTPYTKGASFTLPSGVGEANGFIVTAEVKYAYTPTIGYALTGTISLSDQFWLRPRYGGAVEWKS
jgi:Flp pilus assembly protein TadG